MTRDEQRREDAQRRANAAAAGLTEFFGTVLILGEIQLESGEYESFQLRRGSPAAAVGLAMGYSMGAGEMVDDEEEDDDTEPWRAEG